LFGGGIKGGKKMQEVIFQMFLIKSTTDLSKGILE
jgi:hypothetical protein